MRKGLFIVVALLTTFVVQACAQAGSRSTIEDQRSVEVTVYNSNLGLIKDVREFQLPFGKGELRFMDVAADIMPETVHVKSLTRPDDLAVLEQNYEYDLINSDKLLDKYVGKKIKLVDWNEFQDKKEIVEAELISNNNGQVYKINDEIYLGHPGYKILPQIPENLIAKPTLTWLYNNRFKGLHRVEVSYLTNNINWKADYVLVLNETDTKADLSGWVTLDNKSGTTYKDAQLKLIAGKVQRVSSPTRAGRGRRDVRFLTAAEAGFQEKEFFEYHIYNLQRKTTIKDNQKKQVSLLEANNVGIVKELLAYGVPHYFRSQYPDQKQKVPVNVYVKFKNSKSNHAGMPLPAGIVRLYKEDDDKSLQFIGEDRVDHTPKDEEVKLKVGEAFDVVVERRQLDYNNYKRLIYNYYETEWELIIKNHKKEDVVVGIVESLSGDWSVLKRSHPYEKVDAFNIRFNIRVPKDGTVKLTYRVRVSS